MRNASEYDLFVPLTYNDGTPIEADKITQLRQRLPGGEEPMNSRNCWPIIGQRA